MKRFSAALLLGVLGIACNAQKKNEPVVNENTLLWKITGKGLEKPSYLFGTIHMLCSEDAVLSPNMKTIIGKVDEVYFEVDLDNMFEMLGVMSKLKMRGDTTLHDLLSEKDYEKVKNYFESKSSPLPFSMLETYKPILASSLLEQNSFPCETTAMMEQVIMQEAKHYNKKIQGMETMGYQASVLDDIPYKVQAEQLVTYIDSSSANSQESKELTEMLKAYKEQDLKKLEEMMMKGEVGVSQYAETLLYKRNRNWVEKLGQILPGKSLLIAVGAGHLPGAKGVIGLLRKAGYNVTPEKNDTREGVSL
ncbi:MAG TPA: TraB/GumN family protein [Chitinophagaceae bacterium]|nr:TraB/GumN family protein [Chitinophagaceae bacterium]